MRKRLLSLLLAAAMLASMLPAMTLTAAAAETTEKEIDQSTYEALGLNLYSDEDAAADSVTAPYKEEGVATSIAAREVYAALNAASGNRYTLRDGLDTVDNTGTIHDDTRDQHSGAYAFYGGSPSSIKAENGNTVSSGLSTNKEENVLASEDNGFSGIYATSVALDGGDGKDNYVAELRAYGNTEKTSYGGRDDYAGKLEVAVFKIGDDGSRTQVTALTPKLDASSFFTNSLAYMTRRYVQELDAYFEIEAGDLNGDGLDDLAVYTGRYKDVDGRRYALVDVFYATGSGQWESVPSQEIAVDAGNASNYSKIDYSQDWKEEIVKHPVVTIAMGDIDRNLKDELALVSSAPANNNDADTVAHFSLLAYEEDGSLSPVGGMDNVALNDGAGSGLISAGCAFGEFAQIDNESVSATTLIIGGWSAGSSVITENKAEAGYSQGAYYYVYYDYATGQYIQSGYRAQSLGGHTKSISQVFNLEGQENGGNGVRVYPTLAPMAVACGDLDGAKVQSVSDQVLFGTQVMEFSLETGFGTELFSFDFCMTQVDDKNNNRDKEQPWIGDVVVGTVDSDPGSKNWREMFLFVTGVHRKSEINTSDDYYYMDLGAIWRNENASVDDAKAGYHVLFEGVMAKSNARNDQYGTFVSLALPDVGNDSVVMKFVDKSIVYTDPEVFAVLQASPYFSDLEEVYGYIGNGGTSYGESSGSSTTGGASVSASFGAYASAKIELGPAVEFEHSLVATASYDYGYSSDKETAISYNNQAGSGDKVVVYTIPNVLYLYDVYIPGDNGEGTWEQVVLTTPLQAVVTMLDVDAYDEVAASTAGLEPIRGNILYSIPGQPETYVNKPAGKNKEIYKTYAQSSSGGSGSDITQEFSFSMTDENSFSVGFDYNFKAGAGGGIAANEAMAGITGNIAASGSVGWSKTSGTSFSGTVDALPEEATNYSFSWRLLVNQATLGDNDVWVVGYDVKDVVQPPKMPQNLTITEVGTDYVNLEWENGGNAAYYILYQKAISGGGYNRVAVLPPTQTSYTHSGRQSNTTYTYTIQAVSAKGETSIYSPEVSATTMSNDARFWITQNPDDSTTYAGGSVQFTARGVGEGSGATVGYEWQVNPTGKATDWQILSGSGVQGTSSSTLTVHNVTEKMDGYRYRCRVYYDSYELYTSSATLTVDKAQSKVTLGGDVEANDILSATGSFTVPGTDIVAGRKLASITDGGKSCTLLSAKDSNTAMQYYWYDGTDYYAYVGSAIVLDGSGQIPVDTEFTAADVGGKQDLTTSYSTTINVSVSEDGGVLTKTLELGAPEDVSDGPAIPDPEGTPENPGTPYTATRKWTAQDGDTVYTVYEATRAAEDKIETETFYTVGESGTYTVCTVSQANAITVSDGVTLNVNDLTSVYQTTATETGTSTSYTSEGEAYTLTATPAPYVSGGTTITGEDNTVYFQISGGLLGETVNAVWNAEKQCYEAQWTPTREGKFTIAAVFAGNDLYLGSQSEPITVYAAVQVQGQENKALTLNGPASLTYLASGNLEATLMTANSSDVSYQDVTASSTYAVQKLENGKLVDAEENTDYTLSDGVFTPKTVTSFQITATYNGSSATTAIQVNKGTLTLAAQDAEHAVNDADRSVKVTATTSDGTPVSLTADADYTVTCEGITTSTAGKYPITLTLKDSETVKGLQSNYNILLKNAVYTLTAQSYAVNAAAVANGSVTVEYQTSDMLIPISVNSGTKLPENSHVTFTAQPNLGYQVAKWTVNGTPITDGDNFNTSLTYEVEELTEELTVQVEFAPSTVTLTYGADNSGGGTVTANYLNASGLGDPFASGSNVNYSQSFRITATPEENYAIDHWTIQEGNGEAETILASDGTSNYTGTTYDLSRLTANTVVTVYFVQNTAPTLTLNLVDNNGDPQSGAGYTVKVNNDTLTESEGQPGSFVYTGNTGDNLTVTITAPDGVLLETWTLTQGQSGTLSPDNSTLTLYNLTESTVYIVKCNTLNSYTVNFSGTLEGGELSETVGTVSAVKIGGSDIAAGSQQLHGAVIRFTAQAKKGYEIAGWTVNGQTVQPENGGTPAEQSYLLTLSDNANVVVTFRAKPQITILPLSDGTITVTGTVNGQSGQDVTNNGYVDYGTDIAVTVIPESSHVVTKICDTEVNEAKANGSQSITIQTVTSAQTISAELTAKPIVTIDGVTGGMVEITGTVDGQSGQKVADGGYVDFGTQTTVTATPGSGYVVESIHGETVNESKTNGAKTATIAVPDNGLTVSATFLAKPVVTIGSAANGSVTVKGTADGVEKVLANSDYVDFGTDMEVTLSPDKGYVVADSVVADYTDGTGKTTDDKTYTISDVQMDQTITPVWTELATYAIEFSVVDLTGNGQGNGGTLSADVARKDMTEYNDAVPAAGSGSATVYAGGTITLTAAAEDGYRVKEWTVDGQVYETNGQAYTGGNLTLTPDQAQTVTVQFQLGDPIVTFSDPDHGTLTAETERGTPFTSGGATSVAVNFTVNPDTNYEVKQWTVNGAVQKDGSGQIITELTFSIKPSGDVTVAVELQGVAMDVTAYAGRGGSASVSPETVRYGERATVTAIPENGYVVESICVDDEVLYTNSAKVNGIQSAEYQISADTQFTVTFTKKPVVTFSGVNGTITAAGTVDGAADTVLTSGSYVDFGSGVIFTAQADTGYSFDGWYVEGSKVEDAAALSYTVSDVSADVTVEVRFTATADNKVEFSVSDDTLGEITAAANGGPIQSGAMLAGGTKVVFAVVPQEGYRVKEWTGLPSDAEISDDKNTATVVALPGSLTVQAVLEAVPMHTVTIETPQHGTITAEANGQPISSGAQVPDGTQVTFTANPEPNWIFSAWTGDAFGQSNESFTVAVTGDITVGVTFEDAIHYVVHYSVLGTGGTLSGTADDQNIAIDTDVQVVGGSKVVFTAEPESGMMVKAWTVNGQKQKELSNTLVIDNLGETTTVTVEFEALVFYDLPADTADYTISDINKEPADGSDRQIRKGGDAAFKVVPAQGKTITALTASSGSATQNADGSWTVTVENVQDNITLNATVASGLPLMINAGANGTVTVKRGEDTLSSGAVIQAGQQLTITAAANSGYKLKSLTVNGETFTSGSVYTVKGTDQAVTVEATFEKQPDQGGGGGGGGGGAVASDYPITVLDSVHGTVVADKERAEKDAVVTLTVKPDQGYQLDTLTVTDKDGESVKLTDKGDGIFTFQMPASKVTVEAAFVEENTQPVELPFIDVHEEDWFFDAVYDIYHKNLMDGTSSITFEPFLTTTRSMMVTILWRLEGEPLVDDAAAFEDVEKDTWYTEAINWGASVNVITGYSDKAFGPNDIVTREQLATILYRYALDKGYDVSAKGDLSGFTDGDATSSWAVEAVEWAVGSGLLTGKGGGVLDPTGSATRAEVAAILMRFVESVK